tara:strand:- start:35 stop:817 length:783 start_codon:yes stop_codon:yes gene_type:complete
MPTADSFTALGKGNGFPFCVTNKINVSFASYDWITLGGTRKGNNPTKAEIQTSFVNAVKIFWNTNKLLCSVESSKTSTELPQIIYRKESEDGSVINPTTDPEEPKNRACERDNGAYRNLYTVGIANGLKSGFISLGVMRMYDGDVNDEDNFVGYGLEDGFSVQAESDDEPDGTGNPPTPGRCRVTINVSSRVIAPNTAYITFSGFPLVCGVSSTALQFELDGSVSTSADASTASGSASYSNSDISGSVSASITGLDLYTY